MLCFHHVAMIWTCTYPHAGRVARSCEFVAATLASSFSAPWSQLSQNRKLLLADLKTNILIWSTSFHENTETILYQFNRYQVTVSAMNCSMGSDTLASHFKQNINTCSWKFWQIIKFCSRFSNGSIRLSKLTNTELDFLLKTYLIQSIWTYQEH